MTSIVIYALLSILLLVLAAVLVRQSHEAGPAEIEGERDYFQDRWDGPSLTLAERLFDPADYVWLRDRVQFPHIARFLVRSRKQMALRWLKALRSSFDDLVRTPEPTTSDGRATEPLQNWKLLWLILRFQCLIGYAMFVVRFFGPYHRLIPPLGWVRPKPEPATETLASKRLS